MAQSQCRRSVGDQFWPGVVVENKESLNNPSNNPNKSGAVTLSEIFSRILTRFCRKIVGLASDRHRLHRRRSETISASVFSFNLFSPWVFVTASCSKSVSNFQRSGRRRPYIHGDLLRFHRTSRRRRSQKAHESSQGASDSVGGRRRLLADIESQPEFPIPHRILRLVSDYSEDASD